ncbi:MAG: peptidylprolyl isomerase [Paraclostridium sp.]
MKKGIALILAIALGLMATACSSKEPVALVNGTEISLECFEKTAATYKESVEKIYGESTWEQEIGEGIKYKDELKKVILDQMIQEEVIYQEAKKENLEAKEEDINTKFNELKESISNDEEYAKFLKDNGIDDEFLKYQLIKDMSIQNYKEKFDKETEVSDNDMKKYYEENKDKYIENEVKASHILISTVDDKTNEPLSDKDKKEARKKIEEIYTKVKAGEDFTELARQYSQDEYSAVNGGNLGFFGKGKMVVEFEETAFSLEKGEVSEIIESQFGYHIIKVTDKKYKEHSFDEVRDDIKEQLLYQQYSEQVGKIQEDADIEKNEKEALKSKI